MPRRHHQCEVVARRARVTRGARLTTKRLVALDAVTILQHPGAAVGPRSVLLVTAVARVGLVAGRTRSGGPGSPRGRDRARASSPCSGACARWHVWRARLGVTELAPIRGGLALARADDAAVRASPRGDVRRRLHVARIVWWQVAQSSDAFFAVWHFVQSYADRIGGLTRSPSTIDVTRVAVALALRVLRVCELHVAGQVEHVLRAKNLCRRRRSRACARPASSGRSRRDRACSLAVRGVPPGSVPPSSA